MAVAFSLPARLEARLPREPRDEVRLLVSGAQGVSHHQFLELSELLSPGDLLVVNDSGTLPAALLGGDVPVHMSTRLGGSLEGGAGRPPLGKRLGGSLEGGAGRPPLGKRLGGDEWVIEPRGTFTGDVLELPGGARARVLEPYRGSSRLYRARLDFPLFWHSYLERYGQPIRYPYLEREQPLSAYQSVFARESGSAEMPSAGRPFTRRVLTRLRQRGVAVAALTLHCGVSSLESHESPYPEWYNVPAATLERVRARTGRVIAVGTTVVRALESALDGPSAGWTERVIRPGDRVHVDGILTGLHEPQASHLDMLEAIGGRRSLQRAYAEALEHGYLWHEFGDVHLLYRTD